MSRTEISIDDWSGSRLGKLFCTTAAYSILRLFLASLSLYWTLSLRDKDRENPEEKQFFFFDRPFLIRHWLAVHHYVPVLYTRTFGILMPFTMLFGPST